MSKTRSHRNRLLGGAVTTVCAALTTVTLVSGQAVGAAGHTSQPTADQAPVAMPWTPGTLAGLADATRSDVFAGEPLKPATPVPVVSHENVMKHLRELQRIADANGGDRSHGRPGLQASNDYVKGLLDKAGYKTSYQAFTAKGATGYNLIADLPGGDPKQQVVVGAHLDAVPNVAGISDNGSGSAAQLEAALMIAAAKDRPKRSVRFIWFGAEELIMVGSAYYVRNLSPQQRAATVAYLNYDMLGSPNGGYFIFDADNSDGVGNGPGPAGSAYIEKVHEQYYKDLGIPTRGWDFDGLMDYGPFKDAGIAAGGMATGASKRKTADEARLWGGTAGQAYDACYHRACDTITNLDEKSLKINSQVVAYATWVVAGFGTTK